MGDEWPHTTGDTQLHTALVSGGNRGIGLEVVKGILEESVGSFVFLGCRDIEAGRNLALHLREVYGPHRVEALYLDVTSASSISNAINIVGTRGHLDILVNNAGIMPEADEPQFSSQNVRMTMAVNFEAAVAVTHAFLPLLQGAPNGAQILFTSSGCGTRAMGMLNDADRSELMSSSIDTPGLQKKLSQLENDLQEPANPYLQIPSVGYSLSKLGVNCFAQILARQNPTMRINACSPGFCNTGMCVNYTGTRKPKEPALGASVFRKVMFGELGQGQTGIFFKEASKADTLLEKAVSVQDPWVAYPDAN